MHYNSKYLLILAHIHSIFNRFIDNSPFFFTAATCNGPERNGFTIALNSLDKEPSNVKYT